MSTIAWAKISLNAYWKSTALSGTGEASAKKELISRFEVSDKSIERDFSYMRDRLLAPLDYDRMRDLYFYSDSSYFLPAVSLSEGEVMALALSSEILNHFTSVDDLRQLKEAFSRLAGYLPEEVKVDLSHLNNRVSVITEQQTRLPPDVWNVMMEAVRENSQVSVLYRKPGERDYVSKLLEPYYLVAFRGSWYINRIYERGHQNLRPGADEGSL